MPFRQIILSGDISTDSLQKIATSGCVHLSKPTGAKDLTVLAQRLLAEQGLARAAADAPGIAPSPPRRPAGETAPTVFVVDDEPAIREGLRDFLRDSGYLVEMFADGPAFLEAYRPGRVECLLVDAQMPGMSGIELIERLKSEGRALPAIVITGHGDVALAVQAMKAGAVDFLEKPAGHGELLGLVERALERSSAAPTYTAKRELAIARMASLTARQREILGLVLAGQPSKNIAADLDISQRTVDNHRAVIMRKTGSKSLSALIRTALDAV